MDIIELTQIPRERDKLKAIIGEARYRHRKQQLIRFATYAILVIGMVVLALGACSHGAPVPQPTIYLPLLAL